MIFLTSLLILYGVHRVYKSLNGADLIRDPWDWWKLSRRSLHQWNAVYAQNPTTSDIVVCLTTIPSRIDLISDTLKSLMAQTRRPQRIRLHIPEYSIREQCAYTLPEWLHGLKDIDIIRCPDYGPSTKLIPALEAFDPDQKLLVVDDDRLYPSDMIDKSHFWSQARVDCAIASGGWLAPDDLTDRQTTLRRNVLMTPPTPVLGTRIRKPHPVDILIGYAGYLVRPRFFEIDRLTDYTGAPEAAFYVDDVWISAHCRVQKVVFPTNRLCFKSWHHRGVFSRTSLGRLNCGEGDPEKRNNTRLLRYFKDRWLNAE